MSPNEIKNTPLVNEHIKLGASMVPFGGWNMPVQYTNVIEEHLATRNNAGIFDICHMGEFVVSGNNSEEFLQKLVTNDIGKLEIKQACYNCLCYENGTVVDDLFVYKLDNKQYFIVVNASTTEKDFNWFANHKMDNVDLMNISDNIGKIDVQGPFANDTMQKLTDFDLNEIKRFRCEKISVKDIDEQILISRTGYTGEDGFELFFSPRNSVTMWNNLLEAGKEFGIKPCGLGARDTLRIEACYSLYGHEINENLTPIEAGLGFVVKLNKDFIGKEVLQAQKNNGTGKKLVCFEMIDKSIPRENYPILVDNENVGFVSSGTFSPTFKKGLGMAYIKSDLYNVGGEISVLIRGKEYKGVIVERPFYKYKGGK
ncbi:glycine cleavage system aminomethyltransferase GcvT [Candidatus Woesearchaeota archaeon]|nr:glycine cleavage system aminomethyltransferase GcvT [Candidatus Woesearchaeota archaeon]